MKNTISPFTGIHHTAFATSDMALTVRYWRDLLGMRLVYAYGSPGYRQYFFNIHGSSYISFFEWSEVEKTPYKRHGEPVKGPFAFDHISIGVVNEEALWSLVARMEGADFPVSDVVDHGWFYSVYSYDPNGIPIEFSCNIPGIDVCRDPVIRDQEPPPELFMSPEPLAGQWPAPAPILSEERNIVPGEGKEFFPIPSVCAGRHS
ncbi:MAG: VOC family protein [Magnetococcus sp. XQGC-1]